MSTTSMGSSSRAGKCGIHRSSGDLEAALGCYAEFEELARVEQNPLHLLSFYRHSGEIWTMERRRYDKGHDFAKRGVALSVRLDEWWNRVELKATLAVASAGRGDLATAEDLLAEAKEGSGDVFAAMYATYCRARVRELGGRLDEAETLYREAEDAFAATGFRKMYWPGVIQLDHAELLLGMSRAAEAAAHVATAEQILGTQRGERAARIERIRASLATPSAPRRSTY